MDITDPNDPLFLHPAELRRRYARRSAGFVSLLSAVSMSRDGQCAPELPRSVALDLLTDEGFAKDVKFHHEHHLPNNFVPLASAATSLLSAGYTIAANNDPTRRDILVMRTLENIAPRVPQSVVDSFLTGVLTGVTSHLEREDQTLRSEYANTSFRSFSDIRELDDALGSLLALSAMETALLISMGESRGRSLSDMLRSLGTSFAALETGALDELALVEHDDGQDPEANDDAEH